MSQKNISEKKNSTKNHSKKIWGKVARRAPPFAAEGCSLLQELEKSRL